MIYSIVLKLSNRLHPNTTVEYFKLLKDYFRDATNDDYEFDEVLQRISIKSKFLSSIRLSSGERYPTRAERFPFGLVLNMVKSNKNDIELRINIFPTIVFYLIAVFCSCILIFIKFGKNFEDSFLFVLPFYCSVLFFLTLAFTYMKILAIKKKLTDLFILANKSTTG